MGNCCGRYTPLEGTTQILHKQATGNIPSTLLACLALSLRLEAVMPHALSTLAMSGDASVILYDFGLLIKSRVSCDTLRSGTLNVLVRLRTSGPSLHLEVQDIWLYVFISTRTKRYRSTGEA